jgi:hypothetical protein
MGQKRRFGSRPAASGLPRSTDIFRVRRHVPKVPVPDSCTATHVPSFDHLVGVNEEYSRHIEAERPGRLEIAHSPRPRAYRFVCLHGREDEGRSAAHAMEPIT